MRLCLCLQMVFSLPSQYDDYDSTPYGLFWFASQSSHVIYDINKDLFVGMSERTANRKNRVEIQVFRGPNNEEEQYAPWGYIIRQPSDLAYDARYNSDVFGDF